MKRYVLVLLMLLALPACKSLGSTKSLPKGPLLNPEPMLCSSEAFIKRDEYTLPAPPRLKDPAQQDLAFRQWQAAAIVKYPSLLNSYDLLRKCWDEYAVKRP